MCVAVPARVKEVLGTQAEVEIGGVARRVSIQFTPEAKIDDYLLIHAGFSIHRIDDDEAKEMLKLLANMEGDGL